MSIRRKARCATCRTRTSRTVPFNRVRSDALATAYTHMYGARGYLCRVCDRTEAT